MRANAKTVLIAALTCGIAALTGCGGSEKGGNSVQMKDMEVVDGTATDAMTDLDGVQSEGTAVALPEGNSAANASAPAKPATPPAATADKADDAEVLSDQ
ncbi:hypothetical protein [Sphingobium sp.]|uniref:hypothetical protein n=1 Tax=Sphingobium sp. TaxID=1912891 RepID=UPI003BB7F90B